MMQRYFSEGMFNIKLFFSALLFFFFDQKDRNLFISLLNSKIMFLSSWSFYSCSFMLLYKSLRKENTNQVFFQD